jgi:hypothetical protein
MVIIWERRNGNYMRQKNLGSYGTEEFGILWDRIIWNHMGQNKWESYGTEDMRIM